MCTLLYYCVYMISIDMSEWRNDGGNYNLTVQISMEPEACEEEGKCSLIITPCRLQFLEFRAYKMMDYMMIISRYSPWYILNGHNVRHKGSSVFKVIDWGTEGNVI